MPVSLRGRKPWCGVRLVGEKLKRVGGGKGKAFLLKRASARASGARANRQVTKPARGAGAGHGGSAFYGYVSTYIYYGGPHRGGRLDTWSGVCHASTRGPAVGHGGTLGVTCRISLVPLPSLESVGHTGLPNKHTGTETGDDNERRETNESQSPSSVFLYSYVSN